MCNEVKNKNYYCIYRDKCFLMNGDVLTEVTIDHIDYVAYDTGWVGIMRAYDSDKNEIARQWHQNENTLPKLYDSLDDFKAGNAIAFSKCETTSLTFDNAKGAIFDGVNICYWAMMNGEPQYVKKVITKFIYKSGRYLLCDDDVPTERCYSSREHCLSWSEWTSKDSDGKVKKHIGLNKLLQLDPDQEKLIAKFMDMLDTLNENWVGLIIDNCGDIQAFNTRNIEDYQFVCDNCELENVVDNTDGYVEADRYEQKHVGNIDMEAEDGCLFVKPKKDEDEQVD